MATLKAACGIDFIILQYTKVRSEEARENLFTIIFDYILVTLEAAKQIEFVTENKTEQILALLDILRGIEAPHYFTSLFKYLPQNFSEKFLSFVQRQYDGLSNKIEKPLTVLITDGFEKLAVNFLKVLIRKVSESSENFLVGK